MILEATLVKKALIMSTMPTSNFRTALAKVAWAVFALFVVIIAIFTTNKRGSDLTKALIVNPYRFETTMNIPTAYSVWQLNDTRLAFGTSDGNIEIMSIETKNHSVFAAHEDRIGVLLQLSDGRLASGAHDKLIKIWNLATQTSELILKGHAHNILSLSEIPDGRLISGSQDHSIKIWNLHSGDCEQTLHGHSGGVTSVIPLSNNDDNTWIASASTDYTIRVWDIETGNCRKVIDEAAGWRIISLLDGRLASSSFSNPEDRSIRIWNDTTGHCEQVFYHGEHVRGLLQLSDGRLVSGSNHFLKIWNITDSNYSSGECLQTLSHAEGRISYGGLIELRDHRILSVRYGGQKGSVVSLFK